MQEELRESPARESMAEGPYIGTAGWSYDDWKGVVYPSPPPKGFHGLRFLSKYFNCIEINSTFYRPPSPRTVEEWVRQVRERKDFLFTLKLYQGFTHRDEEGESQLVRAFKEGADILQQSRGLGALLLQFPWYFRDGNRERTKLARLRETFGEYPLVLEVRHNSWSRAGSLAFLEGLGMNFCNIDQPLACTSIRPAALALGDIGYVRLHGRNYKAWFDKKAGRDEKYNYLYSDEELEEWVGKIEELNQKVRRNFVIANNHYRGQAPANALELMHKLTGRKVPVPSSLLRAFPRLEGIAERPGHEQPFLFHFE